MSETRLAMVTIDCADPAAETTFWSAVLGWEVAYSDENYGMVSGPTHAVGFGRVEGFEPPAWPNENGSKQFHLDLACTDIAATEARCLELGATVAEPQGGEGWRVLIDPGGHPFCLTKAENWA
ncbi:VOC family protein [Propionibacteriaceae bacterium Y1685]|uniref:VOC family protein n=1 Tax=Microlunatus sp. Y1700 TaxID=3418487 RepID=UPI003B81D07C